MPWLYEGLERLDWPNLFASTVLALVAGFVAKRAYPTWVRTREGAKFVLQDAKANALRIDFVRVVRFRQNGNLLIVWLIRKAVSLLIACTLLILVFVMMSVTMLSSHVSETPDAKLSGGFLYSAGLWYGAACGVLGGIVFGTLSEIRRITNYYSNFRDLRDQASAVLSQEEIRTIER
jgi:hypothetical protein